MTETIGLKAVLEDKSFQDGVQRYTQGVARMQQANASFSGSGGSTVGVVGNIGNALSNMGQIAGGIIAANVFGRIADGVTSFARTGLDAVGSAQQLEASLKSLLTSNNMYKQVTETSTVAVTKSADELAKEAQRLNDLQLARQTDLAAIQEQKQRIIQLTAAYGDNGLNVQTARAKLAEMENQVSKTNTEIAKLSSNTAEFTNVTKSSWQEVMNQADAYKLAGTQTQELIDYISELAVISPFETEKVEAVAKYAVGAGLGVEKTKEFTAAFLDMAASVGIGSESLDFAADQLLQVKKIGQLTTIDLRQLRRMGIDLEKVLGVEMGMSVEEFNAKAKQTPEIFDELFSAITRFSQNTFAGTSKEMAQSVKGIQSTLSDVFVIGARKFFRPLVDAASPAVNDIVGKISDLVLGGRMEALGQQAASALAKGLGKISTLFAAFQSGGLFGRRTGSFGSSGLLAAMGLSSDMVGQVQSIFSQISGATANFTDAFNVGGMSGLGSAILVSLQGAWTSYIQPELAIWGQQFMGWVAQVYPQIPTMLTGLVTTTASFLAQNWPTISATLSTWSTKFWEWTQTAAQGAAAGLNALALAMIAWAMSSEAQVAMAQMGFSLGTMLTDALKLNFQAEQGAGSVVLTLVSALLNATTAMAGSLIVLGGELVAGITAGILQAMGVTLKPATFSQLSGILSGIGSNMLTASQIIGRNIVTGIMNGWNTMVGTVSNIIKQGVESWQGIITKTDWATLGRSIVDGIVSGINKNMAQVWEILKDLAWRAIKETGLAIGEGSPAKEFIPKGQSIVQGLTAGVTSESKTFSNKLMGILNPSAALKEAGMPRGQRRDISNLIKNMLPSSMGDISSGSLNLGSTIQKGLDAIGSSVSAGQVIQTMERFGYTVAGVTEQITAAYSETEKLLRLENVTSALNTAGQFSSFEQTVAERLTSQIEQLQTLADYGGGMYQGQIISQEEAQQKLNAALAEEVSVKQQIAAIDKQQADLSFLQQQVSLLKMVQDQGLNVADIFGGITFGLDASLPDLIAATSNVVTAMIDQIDTDLKISSPSQVMFDKAQMIGQGIVNGLEGMQPMLAAATQQTMDGIVNGFDKAQAMIQGTPILQPALVGTGAITGAMVNISFGQVIISNGKDESWFKSFIQTTIAETI